MNKRQKMMNETSKCAICFEDNSDTTCTLSTCKHIFHTKCCNKWFVQNDTCPVCRNCDITCQHEDHDPSILHMIIDTQRELIKELKERIKVQDNEFSAMIQQTRQNRIPVGINITNPNTFGNMLDFFTNSIENYHPARVLMMEDQIAWSQFGEEQKTDLP